MSLFVLLSLSLSLTILTVKMLCLLHEKLRALFPLPLKQLLQTLRYGHVAIDATATEHGLQWIWRRRGICCGSCIRLALKRMGREGRSISKGMWQQEMTAYLLAGKGHAHKLRVHGVGGVYRMILHLHVQLLR